MRLQLFYNFFSKHPLTTFIMRPQIPKTFCVVFVLWCCSCRRLACFLCFLAGFLLGFLLFLVVPFVFLCVLLQLKVASKNTQNIFTHVKVVLHSEFSLLPTWKLSKTCNGKLSQDFFKIFLSGQRPWPTSTDLRFSILDARILDEEVQPDGNGPPQRRLKNGPNSTDFRVRCSGERHVPCCRAMGHVAKKPTHCMPHSLGGGREYPFEQGSQGSV